ncbi:uncharacterized protein EI90DRAFT_3051896, partial [Cantharellus anzutake]|uniref:uncharacterized protein n=1 Tax=Cantharellus anzutake TaxID=1750568 RepID=UPI001907CA64
TYINLIFLAKLTDRIPIIAPFVPTHVGKINDAGLPPFGDVFDIPRLAEAIHLPVLEWRDVKLPAEPDQEPETIGGWTAWARWDMFRGGLPRPNSVERTLGLEVSYTNIPYTATMRDRLRVPDGVHVLLMELMKLSYHSEVVRATHNEQNFESDGVLKVKLPPDEHIMTFDFLYFATLTIDFEWAGPWFLPWNMIGTHCHWHPTIEQLAQQYLMRLFVVDSREDIPAYIAIHARRKDFDGQCHGRPKEECFAPLSAFEKRVEEIRYELGMRSEFQEPGSDIASIPVIMTSDETDQSFWDGVRGYGWKMIDHSPNGEDTAAKHGPWYPHGHGFVGTAGSTMSIIASRRVEDWQGGVSREVAWGGEGADDHEPQLTGYRENQARFT